MLEPDPKNLDAWSWSRSLKFESRFHSPASHQTDWDATRETF